MATTVGRVGEGMNADQPCRHGWIWFWIVSLLIAHFLGANMRNGQIDSIEQRIAVLEEQR
jgi:hypothetical protein